MQKSAGVTAPRRCELFIGHIVALLGGCCSNSFVEGFYLLLHHLQKVKFQIVGLRNLRQNGMIRGLLPCLDLPQCHTGILRNISSVIKCEQEQVAKYPPRGSSRIAFMFISL